MDAVGRALRLTASSATVRDLSPSALADYARIPIAFEVRERFAVLADDAGLGGLRLVLEPVSPPYVKDYDADPASRPTAWAEHFDVARWGFLVAHDQGTAVETAVETYVGGAAVAWNSPGVDMLAGRSDVAVLWDLRVAPDHRRRGVGALLFGAAERWAAERGARWLTVETQNVNVPACRFYARRGCTLGAIDRFAYPTLPNEVQLLWYKSLCDPTRSNDPPAPQRIL